MKRSNLIFALILFLVSSSYLGVSAQPLDKFKPGKHIYNGTEIPYQLYIPSNYDLSTKYPLILYLHGAGSRGTDNQDHIGRPSVTFLTSDSIQKQHPSFILAPQCPQEQQWVDFPWYKGVYGQDTIPISNELETVVALLDSIVMSFSIDSRRLYAIGESMGGFGTWDIVTRNPDKFAAMIAVVGGGDPSKIEAIGHMGIWGIHGTADKSVPVSGTRNMMMTLDSTKANVFCTDNQLSNQAGPSKENTENKIKSDSPPQHIYSEFEGEGHELWHTYIEKYNGMLDWLFCFSK